MPTSCLGVPSEILDPRQTWKEPEAYDKQAAKLAQLFVDNFREFESEVSDEVKAAGPNQKVAV